MVPGLWNTEVRPNEAVIYRDTPWDKQVEHLGGERILAPLSAQRPALFNERYDPLDCIHFAARRRRFDRLKQFG